MRYLRLTVIALFFVLCSLPGLQMAFHISKIEKLHGVEASAADPAPAFSWAEVLGEQYQGKLEEWLGRNIGYRGQLVRTDNQINYSVFGQISSNYASPLVLGKNNTLFEKLYIDAINGKGMVGDNDLRQSAKKLALLQRLLGERGITFLLLISPAKTTVEMESIPPRYLHPARPAEEKSNYNRLLPMLKEANIRMLDSRELLLRWKREAPRSLFARGGTHWNMETSCRVTGEMLEMLSKASGKPIPRVPCEPVETRDVPDPFDRDLADLCNLWNAAPFYESLPYPVAPAELPAYDPSRPRMLFIGGSFLWSMFHYLDLFQIYSHRDMYYYFSRRFRFPSREEVPIDKRNFNWDEVFSNEYIVLEVNEANIRNIGSGFIEAALRALEPVPKPE